MKLDLMIQLGLRFFLLRQVAQFHILNLRPPFTIKGAGAPLDG